MKKLYGYYGGSLAQGFPQTETSDWDYYSVCTSPKIAPYKIYPNVKIHQKKRGRKLDVEKIELCAYLTYLMNGFAFQVESLWIPEVWRDYVDPRFKDLVLANRNLLIDRGQLIENVTCNIENFRKKTVDDIGKLKQNVERNTTNSKTLTGVNEMLRQYRQHGYYHKDYLHGIRLAASLAFFLKYDIYPYRLESFDKEAFNLIAAIKTDAGSGKKTKAELDAILDTYLNRIQEADLSDDEDKFRFDSSYALKVLQKFYP